MTSINSVLKVDKKPDKKLDLLIIAFLAYILGSSIHCLVNDIFDKYDITLKYKLLYNIVLVGLIVYFVKRYYKE